MKDITREELIQSKEYWVTNIQLKLFAEVDAFMKAVSNARRQPELFTSAPPPATSATIRTLS